jgi:hypothetical protein
LSGIIGEPPWLFAVVRYSQHKFFVVTEIKSRFLVQQSTPTSHASTFEILELGPGISGVFPIFKHLTISQTHSFSDRNSGFLNAFSFKKRRKHIENNRILTVENLHFFLGQRSDFEANHISPLFGVDYTMLSADRGD